jgi:hypothetical protein
MERYWNIYSSTSDLRPLFWFVTDLKNSRFRMQLQLPAAESHHHYHHEHISRLDSALPPLCLRPPAPLFRPPSLFSSSSSYPSFPIRQNTS